MSEREQGRTNLTQFQQNSPQHTLPLSPQDPPGEIKKETILK